MGTERLGGLDLLRGIAALAIVFFHLHIAFPVETTAFSSAYLAVDFFFMLSGFVLTRTYHQRFLTGLGAGRFFSMRLKRLWPTIAIGAVLGLIAHAGDFGRQDLALFFALNLAMIPYLAGGVIFPLNGVTWSILFELAANLVHARLLARLSRAEILVLALAMGAVMVFVATKLEWAGNGPWDVGAWPGNFVAGLPRVILAYAIGSVLFRTFGDRPRPFFPAWLAPLLLPAALLAGPVIDGGWLFDLLFVICVCPVVLIAGLTSFSGGRPIERWAGDLSFPLYAVHSPIMLMAGRAGLPWFTGPLLAILAAAATLYLTQRGSILAGQMFKRRPFVQSRA